MVSEATDVRFHFLSFNELWKQWEDSSTTHVQQLRNKYSVSINPSDD